MPQVWTSCSKGSGASDANPDLVNLAKYFESSYAIFRSMFLEAEHLENSVLIGAAREFVSNQILSFFLEPRFSGWILDDTGKTTGQMDLLFCQENCLTIPGAALSKDATVKGAFGRQVALAFEFKSSIGRHFKAIMGKTWECQRLRGGHSIDPAIYRPSKTGKGHEPIWPGHGVPLAIIGAGGFANLDTYGEHFQRWASQKYSVNKQRIETPLHMVQVIPHVLLDMSNDTLLIQKTMRPDLLPDFVRKAAKDFRGEDHFWIFRGLPGGMAFALLVHYIDTFRIYLRRSQLTAETPLSTALEMSYGEQSR